MDTHGNKDGNNKNWQPLEHRGREGGKGWQTIEYYAQYLMTLLNVLESINNKAHLYISKDYLYVFLFYFLWKLVKFDFLKYFLVINISSFLSYSFMFFDQCSIWNFKNWLIRELSYNSHKITSFHIFYKYFFLLVICILSLIFIVWKISN